MLDPNEKLVFDGMVMNLRAEDPKFHRRTDRLIRPRYRMRMAFAILLWTLAPISIVYGGWTGALLAVVAVGYGVRLMTRRNGNQPQPLWWTASRGRSPDQLA